MRWENVFGSRNMMYFVVTLIALEIVALLNLILLPAISMNIFFGFILTGFIHLVYFISIFFTLIIGLGDLRTKKIAALNSFLILVLTAFILFFLNQKATTIRFWIFRSLYTDIATRVIDQKSPIQYSDSPLQDVFVPKNSFLVGYGQDARIQSAEVHGNSLVFFAHSGWLFTECGYVFSSMNKMPDVRVFDFGDGARGGFDPIAPNWFYGCITYD